MRYRVDALECALLDAAVARAEGMTQREGGWYSKDGVFCSAENWRPSRSWAWGGPIISRELIFFSELPMHEGGPEVMVARCGRAEGRGRGHLESGMRAYVASRFGEFVELP